MKSVGAAFLMRLATFPVTAAATLLTTALVIHYTGSMAYGAIMLVANLFQLIPFADLGLGAVVINAVAQPDTTAEHRHRIIAGVVHHLAVVGAIVAAVAFSGTLLFSWSGVLGIDASIPYVDISTAVALALYGLAVPLGIGQRILIGLGKNHLAIAVSAGTSVVTLAVTLLMIGLQAPAAILSIAVPAGILATSIVGFAVGRKLVHLRWRTLLQRSGVAASTLARTAAPMLVIMIGLPIALHSGRLFLAWMASPQELSEFTLAMQLYTPLWSFVTAAGMSLWPIFARANSDQEASRSLFRRSLAFFLAAGVFGSAMLALVGPWLGSLISQDKITLTPTLMIAVAAVLLVQTVQQVPGMFLTSAEGLKFQAVCVVVYCAAVVAGTWLLTPVLGPAGPPVVLAFSVLTFQLLPGLIRVSRTIRLRTREGTALPRPLPHEFPMPNEQEIPLKLS